MQWNPWGVVHVFVHESVAWSVFLPRSWRWKTRTMKGRTSRAFPVLAPSMRNFSYGTRSILFLHLVIHYLNEGMRGVHLTIQRWDVQTTEIRTLPILIHVEYKRSWSAERVPDRRPERRVSTLSH